MKTLGLKRKEEGRGRLFIRRTIKRQLSQELKLNFISNRNNMGFRVSWDDSLYVSFLKFKNSKRS